LSLAPSQPAARPHSLAVRFGRADRRALLLGTALVSVLTFGYGRSAHAQVVINAGGDPPLAD